MIYIWLDYVHKYLSQDRQKMEIYADKEYNSLNSMPRITLDGLICH